MKPKFTIIFILMAGLSFSGCAGLQELETSTLPGQLPDMVPESFHFNVRDAATRRYLATTNPDSLPPDRRLEVLLLRELGRVSAEKEIPRVFDRLWEEHEEIRELIHRPGQREGFMRPLVDIYYLLTAAPGSTWQEETAERLYQETLSELQPQQLSGYALHFFTLALLKSGKFDAVLPFLYRMEHFTTAQVYLRDLSVALNYSVNHGNGQISCQLIASICEKAITDNLKLPDKALESAILALQKAGKYELARQALLPIIRQNPQLQRYSFVQILKESRDIHLENWQIKDSAAAGQTGRHTPICASEKQGTAISGLADEVRKVRIEVQVIKAGRQSNHIDPALTAIGNGLKGTLNFSSFTLVGAKTLCLGIGEKVELAMDVQRILRVVLQGLKIDSCRIEVTILDADRKVFHTFVESVNGGITTIGGPQTGDEFILLRITTFIAEVGWARKYLCTAYNN